MSRFYTNVDLVRNEILLRGYQNGKRIQERLPYRPYLFLPKKDGPYKTLDGISVDKIEFESASEARDFIKKYSEVSNFSWYGLNNFLYTFIYDEYQGEIDYDPSLISVVSIDIETPTDTGFPDPELANVPISNITVSKNGKMVVFGCEYYKPKLDNVHYVMCKDEYDLLSRFLVLWHSDEWKPDVITGWNIDGFDIPYLHNRMERVFGEGEGRKLSPWGHVKKVEKIRGKSGVRAGKNIASRIDIVYEIRGISSLDYMELYKKFSFTNQESFSLNHIAKVVLDQEKLDYSEFNSLYEFYKKDYERFVDYNIHDVILVDRLEDKLGFIKQVFALAYDAKVNFEDTTTTVRPWDIIIHNYLMDRKIVIPQRVESNDDFELVGGYVKEPHIGMHHWVVSFDLNSLYPHLIMQYNISPETYVGKLEGFSIESSLSGVHNDFYKEMEKHNVCVAANGCAYTKERHGFFPEIMQKMYDDRVEYKNKMIEAKKQYELTPNAELEKLISRYHNMQFVKKIQLNSAYGALGNKYFRWFDLKHAEAITTSGQLAIKYIEKEINEYLNKLLKTKEKDYVIASDTDSIYITLDALVSQLGKEKPETSKIVSIIDKFCQVKLEPFIDEAYERLGRRVNAYSQKMKMKRENIANRGIWTAKKRYMLNVYDQEGVTFTDPKLKMMGIEAIRSSTPAVCKDNIKKAIMIIMSSDDERELRKFVAKFREEFNHMSFDQVAFPRACNYMKEYSDASSIYKKGTPIHVRGALLYNYLIKQKKLDQKLPKIMDGDKIKFAYMKLPNPIRENVFSTPGEMPRELALDKYIDYDLQFEKAFIDPIMSILKAIGWDLEERASLSKFWS